MLFYRSFEERIADGTLFDNIDFALEKCFEFGLQAKVTLKEVIVVSKRDENVNIACCREIITGCRANQI